MPEDGRSWEETDFDAPISRAGTACMKYDGRADVFGRDDVLPLWVADMDFASPACVRQALAARLAHPVLGYPRRGAGMAQALVEWQRRVHDWAPDPRQVRFTPGVVPALFQAVRAFTRPGDGVVVQPPVYHPFFHAVHRTGRRLVENPLRLRDGRLHMDVDHLDRCLADAGLMLLCSPHNPGGSVWRQGELETLLAACRRHGVVLVSDEIHADLVLPGARHRPSQALAAAGDRVVTLLAPSKTFNIAGMATAAAVIPDARLRQAFDDALAEVHMTESHVFGDVAFEAAYRCGGPWRARLLDYLHGNRQLVIDFFRDRLPAVDVVAPEAGFLAWLDCRRLGLDDAGLMGLFVERAGLGPSPGTLFGSGGSGFMRLNFGLPRAGLAVALERLAAVC